MDRISGLPDEVLCHILSFLPTKRAALTSVLSTRWRNLLAFVPNLDITSNKIVKLDGSVSCVIFCGPISKEDTYGTMRSFMAFMDRLLALQGDYSIKKVSLKCKNYVHPDHLNRWIRNVLRRGVSDLELFIFGEDGRDDRDYLLPQEMFVSRTLVKLKLSKVRWWPGAEGIFLPNLKTLIISLDLNCKDKLEMLLPSFPVLEELYIKNIEWKTSGDTFSSASLKKLTIYAEMTLHAPTSMSISFDTPSLLYLEYFDEVASDYPKVNLTNLVEAVLDLKIRDYLRLRGNRNGDWLRKYVVMRCGNLWKLMSGIRNVKTLTFSCVTLEFFSLCFEKMPVFNNLKTLRIRIRSCSSWGWKAMPVLLKNCPHLETLHIKRLFLWDSISREDKDLCLTSCPVKKIQIESCGGTTGELRLVKHLLESFPCLKEMKIFPVKNYHTDIFDLVVRMVNLCNESYRVVVFNSWCVIHRI